MQILIEHVGSQRFILETEQERETITALDIKKMIQVKVGIPIEEQRIISCGKLWKDAMTECDIQRAHPEMRDIGLNEGLHLFRIPIPEHLKSFVSLEYQDLKKRSVDLACEISQSTRPERIKEKDYPGTESYWGSLDCGAKVAVLQRPDCASIVSSILTKEAVPSSSRPQPGGM